MTDAILITNLSKRYGETVVFRDFSARIPLGETTVITGVSGGGKTTLMYALAREAKTLMPTALFTTTHIMAPSDADVILSVPFSEEECRAAWREGKIASSGTRLSEERKYGAPEEDTMRFLCRAAGAVIIEADGARRLPVKFPAAWEPVIRPETTHIVAVAGLSALEQKPEEIVHRYTLAKDVVDLSGEALTEEQMADLLWAGYGRFDPIFFLNQADTPALLQRGERICAILRAHGARRAVPGSLHALRKR